MGNFLARVCSGALRPKTVDTSSADLKQDLTLIDLVSVGLSGAVGVSGCLLMGVVTSEMAGPSVVLSVLMSAVISIMTGRVCAELGSRIPRSGGAYTLIYATLGEVPAIMVASCLLLDLCVLSALAARGITEYIEAISNQTFVEELRQRFPQTDDDSWLLATNFDVVAAGVVVLATLMAVFTTKGVCRLSTIFVALSVLILSAIGFTTLLRANVVNWTKGHGFFLKGISGVLHGGALLAIAMHSWTPTGIMAGETPKYSTIILTLNVALPVIALLLFFPIGAGVTLNSSVVSANAFLSGIFPGQSLVGMRVLVAIGTGFGLWASIATGILVAARILNCLSRDNLAPSVFGKVSVSTGTPWPATLCCGFASALTAGVASTWLLVRMAGVGGLAAGLSGSLAVVARRYHPMPVHSLELIASKDSSFSELQQITMQCSSYSSIPWRSEGSDDTEDEMEDNSKEVSVEWKRGSWISSVVEPLPSRNSARTTYFLLVTFVANSAAGAMVARIASMLGKWWVFAGALLCVSGCLVSAFGVWMQPRHPPPLTCVSSPGMPLLPLAAVLANTLLLFHLPVPALIAGTTVAGLAICGWVFRGYRNSIEAILSRALLTRCPSVNGDSL